MSATAPSRTLEQLDALMERVLGRARIPGAAIAIVAGGQVLEAKGYGYRDLAAKLPVTAQTAYPIASTTKAINATVLGMLVDEGKLEWDASVQSYLPYFQLGHPITSARITVRDLITMRTGLPRHDWLWAGNPISRADLVKRLRHLELSADLRAKFQYNNLTVTTAGHVAEVITGQSWEELARSRILEPLEMRSTVFTQPAVDDVTLSYHENARRELVVSRRLTGEVTAPSGGAIYSTVENMAQWISFNRSNGRAGAHSRMRPQTLAEIHSPQIVAGADSSAPSAHATYALGWFVDTYNGHLRLSHSGYHHDVNSEVMLFPGRDVGIVSFTNFGTPALARLIDEHAFDVLMGLASGQSLEEKLAQYEKKILENRQRIAATPRVEAADPSRRLEDYVGTYDHPGYGRVDIRREGRAFVFHRQSLALALEHWHYDTWRFVENDLCRIHKWHAFDPAGRVSFETSVDGEIAALAVRLEPAVAPIRFVRSPVPLA